MIRLNSPGPVNGASESIWDDSRETALLQGEIFLKTRAYSAWGGAVVAWMYLPLERAIAWQQLTDYPRWVHYFPDMTRSEVLDQTVDRASAQVCKRLYQVANKAFLFFSAQVEVYLKVFEITKSDPNPVDGSALLHSGFCSPTGAVQQIQFRLERGSFHDFSADLQLQDCGSGTLLTYAVQATPTIPVPTLLIQQAIQLDLPTNMRKMRQVLCVGN